MDTSQALTLLGSHQAAVLAHLPHLVSLLNREPEAAREPLARTRWELIRLLRAYQLFKHGEIFGPLLAGGTPDEKRIAGRMERACTATGDRLLEHVARWSTADIVANWTEYRAATLAVVALLRAHIASERDEIARLLDGAAIPRRRRA